MTARKLLEAAFRRLWLLVLPIVVTPLLVLPLARTAPKYQSIATVWVSQPANIDPTTFSQSSNPYQSAADIQVQAMRDLLNTKSFRVAVAADAGMTSSSDDVASDVVARSTQVASAGANLITISASGDDPQLLQRIVSAVISAYETRTTDESQRETSIAFDYYNSQITLAQTELDVRRTALNTYLAANPKAPDAKPLDTTYQRLLGAVDSQSKVIDGLISSLQDAQRKAASSPQSLAATFSVQDAANLPQSPQPVSLTKRVGYPMAGLLFGIMISAGYLYVTFRTDHAIRSSEDLVGLEVPLLGYIPDLPASGRGLVSRFNPLAWIKNYRRRDYARAVAASISSIPVRGGVQ